MTQASHALSLYMSVTRSNNPSLMSALADDPEERDDHDCVELSTPHPAVTNSYKTLAYSASVFLSSTG